MTGWKKWQMAIREKSIWQNDRAPNMSEKRLPFSAKILTKLNLPKIFFWMNRRIFFISLFKMSPNFWHSTGNESISQFFMIDCENLSYTMFYSCIGEKCLSKLDRFHRYMIQGILKGEVSLYCWPPVWLVWNQPFDNSQQTNPNQSNRRSTVQWYFPL